MPRTKRSASLDVDTRPTKAAKANEKDTATSKKPKPIPRTEFRTEALPIHVNFTHTPAALPKDDNEIDVPKDPGHIGSITLLPTDFSTGSYGWKGQRRMTIELPGGEGEDKKTVQVMVNINATVAGSKEASKGKGGKEYKSAEEVDEDTTTTEPEEK